MRNNMAYMVYSGYYELNAAQNHPRNASKNAFPFFVFPLLPSSRLFVYLQNNEMQTPHMPLCLDV